MASRSLTDVFILMRNNAMQNRHIFSDQVYDDQTALVGTSTDVRYHSNTSHPSLPPDWVDVIEEVQYHIKDIQREMKELSSQHTAHLNRPRLDDTKREEEIIEERTQRITQLFHESQIAVQKIKSRVRRASPQQQKLATNVSSSLAQQLQDLSAEFRRTQTDYLNKMKQREERASSLFQTDRKFNKSNLFNEYQDDEMQEVDLLDQAFTRQQTTQLVEENSSMVEHRERELKSITQSINDLNTIFKDLAAMIVDQGTVLDRIDYNIEHTVVHVEEGHQQLVKAEKHQKKNRKLMIILVLAGIVVLLFIILLAVKT